MNDYISYAPHDLDTPTLTTISALATYFGMANVPIYIFFIYVLYVNRKKDNLCSPVFDLFRAIGVNDVLAVLMSFIHCPFMLDIIPGYTGWLMKNATLTASFFFIITIASIESATIMIVAININRLQSLLYPATFKIWWSPENTRRLITLSFIIPWLSTVIVVYLMPLRFYYAHQNRTDALIDMFPITEISTQQNVIGPIVLYTVLMGLAAIVICVIFFVQIKALLHRVALKTSNKVTPIGTAAQKEMIELKATKNLMIAGSILLLPILLVCAHYTVHQTSVVLNVPILYFRPDSSFNPITVHVCRQLEYIVLQWFSVQNPYVLYLCSTAVRDATKQQLKIIIAAVKRH